VSTTLPAGNRKVSRFVPPNTPSHRESMLECLDFHYESDVAIPCPVPAKFQPAVTLGGSPEGSAVLDFSYDLNIAVSASAVNLSAQPASSVSVEQNQDLVESSGTSSTTLVERCSATLTTDRFAISEPGVMPPAILGVKPLETRYSLLEQRVAALEARESERVKSEESLAQHRRPKKSVASAPKQKTGTARSRLVDEIDRKLKLCEQKIREEYQKIGAGPKEIEEALLVELYSLSSRDLASKLGYSESRSKTLSRTDTYQRWKPHRCRGNSRRYDSSHASAELINRGGATAKSGRTRNQEFAAATGLTVGRESKLEEMDPEYRRQLRETPEAQDWYDNHQSEING
jgi:hypothetical protein